MESTNVISNDVSIQNTHKISPLWYCILAMFLLWGIYVTLYDLHISQTIVHRQSSYGIWIEKYGELPGLCIIWAGLLIQAVAYRGRNMLIKICVSLLCIFVAFFVAQYFVFRAMTSYLEIPRSEIKNFVVIWEKILFWGCLSGSVLTFLSGKLLVKHFPDNALFFAKVVIWQAGISQVCVQFFKTMWGRVRFRDLAENYTNFMPWYIPQGIDGHHSFPSGHTALGWMFLACVFLISANKYPKVQKLCLVCAILAGIAIGFGRMFVGAHYASDVWFASLVTILPFVFFWEKQKYCH